MLRQLRQLCEAIVHPSTPTPPHTHNLFRRQFIYSRPVVGNTELALPPHSVITSMKLTSAHFWSSTLPTMAVTCTSRWVRRSAALSFANSEDQKMNFGRNPQSQKDRDMNEQWKRLTINLVYPNSQVRTAKPEQELSKISAETVDRGNA